VSDTVYSRYSVRDVYRSRVLGDYRPSGHVGYRGRSNVHFCPLHFFCPLCDFRCGVDKSGRWISPAIVFGKCQVQCPAQSTLHSIWQWHGQQCPARGDTVRGTMMGDYRESLQEGDLGGVLHDSLNLIPLDSPTVIHNSQHEYRNTRICGETYYKG
jgi:hypothetical protein